MFVKSICSPSHKVSMVICPGNMQWLFTIGICRSYFRGFLPWKFAAAICHGNLPQLFAVAICCGNLLQLFAVAICRGYLPWVCFLYVNKPFFLCASIFFLCKRTFFKLKANLFNMRAKLFYVYENFFFNSVSFCFCRGSYGPPYYLSYFTDNFQKTYNFRQKCRFFENCRRNTTASMETFTEN